MLSIEFCILNENSFVTYIKTISREWMNEKLNMHIFTFILLKITIQIKFKKKNDQFEK
jgi:hypothetical protein